MRTRRMILWANLYAAILLGVGALPAARDSQRGIEWQDIGQLCGYLHRDEPTRKMIRTQKGKWEERLYVTPVKGAKVKLYRATDDETGCCKQEFFIGETKSGVNGEWEFPNQGDGRYWLVVELKEGAAQVPLITDKYEPKLCKSRSTHRHVIVDAKPHPRVEILISCYAVQGTSKQG